MLSWGRERRDLLLFFTHHYDLTTLLVNARQLDQGRAAKQVLQASTLSWAFIPPQLSSFVTKCEQRKLTNSIGGGSLYGGMARPYDSGSARRDLPHFVALQGRWVNSYGPLERASDEYIVAKQSLTTS